VFGAAVIAGACDDDGGDADARGVTATASSATTDAVPAVAEEVYDRVVDAFERGDDQALMELAEGPAAEYFSHQYHGRAALGEDGMPWPNLRIEGGALRVDGPVVVAPGPIGFSFTGEGARPPIVFTDFELHERDGAWRVRSFLRNGIPVGEFVSPPPDDPVVTAGPVTVEALGRFVDVECPDDPDCPFPRGVQVKFLVTNGADTPLEPLPVAGSDGGESVGWLETASGEYPLISADLQGFPPGESSPVTAFFADVADRSGPAVLRIALSADGERLDFEIPVSAHPFDWTDS
jgi:hypothetical protein